MFAGSLEKTVVEQSNDGEVSAALTDEEGGPEVLPSLAAEGGKIPVLSRSFGVASEVKGLLDDCKKLAMNRLYLMNVLGNLPLCLLLECLHSFDVPAFTMSVIKTMPFQEVKHPVLK
jgi:hypothetical protein